MSKVNAAHVTYMYMYIVHTDKPVSSGNTVVYPWAMVVKIFHTSVTLPAVLGSDWTDSFTRVTHVVHRVVEVIVLCP